LNDDETSSSWLSMVPQVNLSPTGYGALSSPLLKQGVVPRRRLKFYIALDQLKRIFAGLQGSLFAWFCNRHFVVLLHSASI
jgi:hypothetical protein